MFKLNTEIKILGETWIIEISTSEKNPLLKDIDGYVDKTSRRIVIADMPKDCEFNAPINYLNKVIRHEVIHAFMFESGLAENWEHKDFGHEETTVDWMAIQFPKIQKVLEKIYGCIVVE